MDPQGGARRAAVDHGERRAPRFAQAGAVGRPRRHRRQRPRHLLPHRLRARLVVGRRPRPPGGRGHRRGGAGPGRRRGARPRHQHQAVAALWAQLRVPLRGPPRGRRARRGPGRGHPEPGCRHLAEALRRQQPGGRPAPRQRRRRRPHPARDLPGRLRAGRAAGRAVDGDVQLQPHQRGLRLAGPVAAHRGAARRVGLRRPGGVRLGRGRRPGRRRGRRARPRDAVHRWRECPEGGRRGHAWRPPRGRARRRHRPPGRAARTGPARRRERRHLRRRRPPRAGTPRRPRVRGPAQERRRAAAPRLPGRAAWP